MNNIQEVNDNYQRWFLDLQDPKVYETQRHKFLEAHRSALTRVQIEPTQRCNFSCHMCPIEEIKGDTKQDLSLKDFISILDQLPSSVKAITLSGLGEPFLNNDYVSMAKVAHNRGYSVEVYNNGSKFNPDILPFVSELFFSLDGVDEKLLQNVRKGIHKDLVLDNIREAVEYREIHDTLNVNINFCVSAKNQHEIEHIYPLCHELNIDHLHFQVVSNNYATNGEAYAEFSNYVNQSHRVNWGDAIALYKKSHDFLLTIWYPRKLKGFCNWTFSSLYINKNMDVISCCQKVTDPMVFGNIKKMNIMNIYHSDAMSDFRRAHENGECLTLCEDCPF